MRWNRMISLVALLILLSPVSKAQLDSLTQAYAAAQSAYCNFIVEPEQCSCKNDDLSRNGVSYKDLRDTTISKQKRLLLLCWKAKRVLNSYQSFIRSIGAQQIEGLESTANNTTGHIYIYGRLGTKVKHFVKVENPFNFKQDLSLKSGMSDLNLSENLILAPLEIDSFYLTATINALESNGEVVVDVNEEATKILPITIEGYDIYGGDFKFRKPLYFKYKNKRKLYFKTPGKEKLLLLKNKKGKILDRISLSQKVKTIDFEPYGKGRYCLEIVNLSTNEKRYLKVKIR